MEKDAGKVRRNTRMANAGPRERVLIENLFEKDKMINL